MRQSVSVPSVDMIMPDAVQCPDTEYTRDTRAWRSDLSRHSAINTWNISATSTQARHRSRGTSRNWWCWSGTRDHTDWMNLTIFPSLNMYSCAFSTLRLCLVSTVHRFYEILLCIPSKWVKNITGMGIFCLEYSLIPNWDIWGTDLSMWGVPQPR